MSDLHEQLAKLMATENIDVVYSAIAKTASFNLETRVLTLPIYDDLPDECTFLLVYHEVGHALFTPLEATKKAYNQVADADMPLFKNILNIIEDVRIEKLIQKKYPGTTSIFKKGYYLFSQKDFFATKNRKNFSFLDRINLYFSLGMIEGKPVLFSDDEAKIVSKIDKSLEFSTTLQIAFEIFSFLKQKQQEKQQEKESKFDDKKNNLQDKNNKGNNTDNKIKDNLDCKASQSEASQNLPNGEEDENNLENNTVLSDSQNKESSDDTTEIIAANNNLDYDDITSCVSKNNFDNQLQANLAENLNNSELKYFYIDDDNLNYKDIIIGYKELYKLFDESDEITCAKYGEKQAYYKNYIANLLHETQQTITSMAAAFEMKKQALLHVKDTIHYSGSVLDCNKLYQYKYNDDIFKKYNITFGGKNHGMIMFLDCSGSMRHTMKETLQQVLSLVLFCRKVNIPFEVYGFSDRANLVSKTKAYKNFWDKDTYKIYYGDDKIDNIMFTNIALKEYFSSKMSKAEFDNAVWIFCYMIMGWDKDLAYSYLPSFETLNCTPLDSAILASKYIINDFKRETNTEIVNAIYLTDGETSHRLTAVTKSYNYSDNIIKDIESIAAYDVTARIIIKNKKTKDELVYQRNTWQQRRTGLTYMLYNLVKKDTGANIINIYLSPDKTTTHHVLSLILQEDKFQEYNYLDKLINEYSKNNIIILDKKDIKAFDSMFIMRVKAFGNIDPNNITVSDNKKVYINNYAKALGKRISNKVFVNNFTDIICKNII